ncbi:hypothetical protein U1Q18_035627 [Sarracenia purpurea var. burkii]
MACRVEFVPSGRGPLAAASFSTLVPLSAWHWIAETRLASRRGSSPLPAAAMGRCGLYLITILASLSHLMRNSWWDRGLVNRAVVDIFSSVRYICSDVLFGSPSSSPF